MKKLILMLMLCAPMTMFAQKFGHLDSQALLQSLPEATSVQQKLEAKGKEYEKQLADMQTELQRKAEEYDKTKSTMNATKRLKPRKLCRICTPRFSRQLRTTKRLSTKSSRSS